VVKVVGTVIRSVMVVVMMVMVMVMVMVMARGELCYELTATARRGGGKPVLFAHDDDTLAQVSRQCLLGSSSTKYALKGGR
jgi:hypothetical protein